MAAGEAGAGTGVAGGSSASSSSHTIGMISLIAFAVGTMVGGAIRRKN